MILGIDASSLIETRACGGRFYVDHQEVDPLKFVCDENGVEILRLRLWVDPYDKDGHPYGGGTSDLKTFLSLAKEGIKDGYKILLDFHYSDFWCDPAKQAIPKAWQGLDYLALKERLVAYTIETLKTIQGEGVELYAIQIGNEITNGMLWPICHLDDGKGEGRKGYDKLCPILKEAALAIRSLLPSVRLMLHLERSYDIEVYREFFDQMVAYDVPFDIIGMSYYPYWHGTFEMLFANVDALKQRYEKPIWIVETAYGFSVEATRVGNEEVKPLVDENFEFGLGVDKPYPLSKDGQAVFIQELIKHSVAHDVEAIVYWEPFWIPRPGSTWATIQGETYVNETNKPIINEWANQCLFDYEGNANPALFVYKKN